MIKLTVLVDNTPNPQNGDLGYEHGFSLFGEFDGIRFICDTGASDLFSINAARLGIGIKDVDFSFMSHAHNDHTGGLKCLLENTGACVFLSDISFRYRMFSNRHSPRKEIGIDQSIENLFSDRLRYISQSEWISDNIAAVKNDCYSYDSPYSNRFITVEKNGVESLDDFSHELSLALDTPEGLIIISPCSHNGAVNIMDSCMRFTGRKNVRAFVGGLHFVDGPQAKLEAARFIENLNCYFPDTTVITGHCTGNTAIAELARYKGVEFFYSGKKITF